MKNDETNNKQPLNAIKEHGYIELKRCLIAQNRKEKKIEKLQ